MIVCVYAFNGFMQRVGPGIIGFTLEDLGTL